MSFKAPQSGIKLLIVDDDRALRAALSRMAQNWDYHVEESASAEDALRELEKSRFNIVLTDIRMDKMDGMTFAAKVRESMPSTAVIIMTGYPTAKTAQKSHEIGAIYHMQKPVGLNALGDTLKIAACWNIGMLMDRGARRFHALQTGTERDQSDLLKAIKAEVQNFLEVPDQMPALRDFVYAAHVEDNALFEFLKAKFA